MYLTEKSLRTQSRRFAERIGWTGILLSTKNLGKRGFAFTQLFRGNISDDNGESVTLCMTQSKQNQNRIKRGIKGSNIYLSLQGNADLTIKMETPFSEGGIYADIAELLELNGITLA